MIVNNDNKPIAESPLRRTNNQAEDKEPIFNNGQQ